MHACKFAYISPIVNKSFTPFIESMIIGHWFHFAERVLPMLTPAHEQVWGPNSIVSPELREEIFLVFAEVRAATTLGTFGRFFLTSILTGGKYKVVHICSASSVLYEGLGVGVDNGERSLVQDLRIHFTIDLSQQDIHDLFVKNFPDKRQDKVHSYICAKTLLQVPLIGYRRMFHWFTHYENVTKFRDSYSDMCGISYSTNETYVRRTRRTQMSASSSHHKPSKNREVGWSNVNKSRKKRSRLRWRLASSDRIEASHTPLNVQINDANDIESNGSSSIGAYGTLSVDRAEGEIRSDYELELGMRDDLEVVRDHGGLRRDPSVYNPFFKNITHNYRKIEIPPLHVIHEKGKQKLLLYQRDASRKVRGVDMFVESLKQQLSATNSTIENSADWEIDLHSHRENGPPCEIIQKLSQTTAFVTAHGFQAFLLIYLPNTALVAEVFPALYYVPTYYGELQLTYRARFGFQRSYLSYESATMTNVMHYGAKLMWGKTHLCRRNIVCRHLSRAQDVKISDEFTKTIAAFLKYNFRK